VCIGAWASDGRAGFFQVFFVLELTVWERVFVDDRARPEFKT
jgi:hypothetical protein